MPINFKQAVGFIQAESEINTDAQHPNHIKVLDSDLARAKLCLPRLARTS